MNVNLPEYIDTPEKQRSVFLKRFQWAREKQKMKEPKPIKFRHRYHKLANDEFTTIRGAGQFKRLKVGQIVLVQTPHENFQAEIIALRLTCPRAEPLSFLKRDAEYPGFLINSHGEFVELLNSFRAPAWKQVEMDSELTVIILRKLKQNS